MKAKATHFSQRAGGWCKPVGMKTGPLSGLSAMSRRERPLQRGKEAGISGNLGGTAESIRPICMNHVGRFFI